MCVVWSHTRPLAGGFALLLSIPASSLSLLTKPVSDEDMFVSVSSVRNIYARIPNTEHLNTDP